MSDLFKGAEDDDFQAGTPPSVSVDTATFRSVYARCSLYAPGVGPTYCKSPAFKGGAVTSCWVTCRISLSDASKGRLLFGLMDSGTGSSGIWIGTGGPSTGSYETLSLYSWDGTTATVLASEAGTSFTFGVLLKLDIQLVNYGASSTINVYLNQVLVISFSGNCAVAGTTALDTVVFSTGFAGAGPAYISEVIVSADDTRTRSLFTKALNGAGDTTAWTGAYTDVNEIVLNDATAVYTNTAAQDEQFVGALLPPGFFTITSVSPTARCSATAGSTPTNIAVGIKSGGTVAAGTPVAQTTAWAQVAPGLDVNPVTGVAFTIAEINALQINFESS